MTSTASKHKNYTSLAFKKTFNGSLVNMILGLCASVVVVLIAISSTLLQNIYDGTSKRWIGEYDMTDTAFAVAIVLTALSGFFSLFIAPKMFRQIYKKQSCDSYFSTPIKREEYFVANYLYGVMVNVMCYVIPMALFIFATMLASNKYINYIIDYKALIPITFAMMLAVIAIYSAFVMCAVISGKRLHYLILSLICLLCTSTTLGGISIKLNSIWGFSVDLTMLSAISPVENAVASALNSNVVPLIIISVIEIIGMFFAGYIAFKNRKAETAEMSLSGKILPCVLLVVFSSSAFFFSATGSGAFDIIVGIVLCVLATMIFSAIFYKKAFTKQTLITLASVVGVCTVLSVVVTLPIFNGYVKYIPQEDKIESVTVSSLAESENYTGIVGMIISDVSSFAQEDEIVVKQKENIKKVMALHEKSIDDAVIKATRKNNSSWLRLMLFLGDDLIDDYTTNVSYKITYKLTNGKTVERIYTVPNTTVRTEYFNILQTEEALSQMPPFTVNNDTYLQSEIGVYLLDEENEYYPKYPNLKNFDVEKFNEALMKDYLSMTQSNFMNTIDCMQSIYFDRESTFPYTECVCELKLYYATEKATPDEIAKYKKMSASQLDNLVTDDWEGKTNAAYTWIQIYDIEKNTIEYLNSCGADIKTK